MRSCFGEDALQHRALVERHETTQRLPRHLLRRVAVNALCSLAPGLNAAIERNAQDSFLRRFEKSCEQMVADQAMRHRNLTVFQKGEGACIKKRFPVGERVVPTTGSPLRTQPQLPFFDSTTRSAPRKG